MKIKETGEITGFVDYREPVLNEHFECGKSANSSQD